MFLVHSYFTDGFFEMAKVFVKSFAYFHTDETPLILDSRSLRGAQVEELEGLYSGLKVFNEDFNYDKMAQKANLTVEQLLEMKKQIENRFVSEDTRCWKLMVAGDDRVKAVYNRLFSSDFPLMLHFDIDTLFKGHMGELAELAHNYDCTLKIREKHKIKKARITIDLMCLRKNNAVKLWMEEWIRNIDAVLPRQRPIGFGQSSCWDAFYTHRERLAWGKLPLEYGLPGRNQKDDKVWTGNVHKLRKDKCVGMFEEELIRQIGADS